MKCIFLSAVLAAALLGCSNQESITMKSPRLADYTFETTPNELTTVGFVFAVDDNKMQIPVDRLNLVPNEGTVVVPSKTATKDVTLGALVKFLGLPSLALTANASINSNTKLTTTFAMDNPTLSQVLLVPLDSALQARKTIIGKALVNQHLENAKVYVIFQTIKARKLTYDFTKTKVGIASLDAVFSKIASTNDSLKWNNTGKGSLSYDLKKNLSVFYKMFQVDVFPGAAGLEIRRGAPVTAGEEVYTSVKH
ncbi:MAG: hypothetical protein ABW007_13115 [Chitinophagaceae bacterium]